MDAKIIAATVNIEVPLTALIFYSNKCYCFLLILDGTLNLIMKNKEYERDVHKFINMTPYFCFISIYSWTQLEKLQSCFILLHWASLWQINIKQSKVSLNIIFIHFFLQFKICYVCYVFVLIFQSQRSKDAEGKLFLCFLIESSRTQ